MFTSTITKQQGTARLSPATLMIPVVLKTFAPLPPLLSFALPANATTWYIILAIAQRLKLPNKAAQLLRLTRIGGQNVPSNTTLSSLAGPGVKNARGQMVMPPITLEVRVGLKGGKGGFASMLRAQGGKMSSNRNGEENNDSCRDLNGRRLSTVKQAQNLALYLSTQAEREKELSETQKKKYAKLEKMLGRKPKGESDFVEAAQKLHEQGGSLEEGDEDGDEKGEGSSSGPSTARSKVTTATTPSNYKGKKRDRIDDTEYIEQSREIVDSVRSAVASAMMKKKKKQKVAAASGNEKANITTAQAV